jgi:hypothetical protein
MEEHVPAGGKVMPPLAQVFVLCFILGVLTALVMIVL